MGLVQLDTRRDGTSTHDTDDQARDAVRSAASNNGSARSLLMTVLGELVLPYGNSVWTSSVLNLMGGLGFEEHTVRQAMARTAASGWIESRKSGRKVRWLISKSGAEAIEEFRRRSIFPTTVAPHWDGQWVILMVTVRQEHRHSRKRLYDALAGAGFGSPSSGVWVSPHVDRMAEAQRIVGELGLRDSSIGFVGPALAVGISQAEIVERGWQLDEAAEHYERFVHRFSDFTPTAGDEVLLSYVGLINAWQQIPFVDPELPAELLPEWIGRCAASLFVELRGRWSGPAHQHWLSTWAD